VPETMVIITVVRICEIERKRTRLYRTKKRIIMFVNMPWQI